MNFRPFADMYSPIGRKVRQSLLLLSTCLVLAACWGGEEATPEATTLPAAEAPVSALPTSDATAEAATEATVSAEAAPTNTSEATAGVAAATSPASEEATQTVESTATSAPLAVEQGGDCEVESSLDLIGYPDLEQQMGCAIEPAIFDPIAINEFGEGNPTDRFMLWFSHEQKIYVLLPDGTYQAFTDDWVENVDPTYPCNPYGGEEDSPPLPRRGFGKLWCENPELQAELGPVPREERLCQYAVLQRFEQGRLLACFEDATIRYFRILDDGKWDLQTQ